MSVDIFSRKTTHFVLWRPRSLEPTPALYIGTFKTSESPTFDNFREIPLKQSAQFSDLWEVPAQECDLKDGQVYYYWFKVRDTAPYSEAYQVVYCTDPMAWTVDRRFPAPVPAEKGGVASFDAASVVLFKNNQLIPCDPQGQTVSWEGDADLPALPTNNRLVIYELPTRWARIDSTAEIVVGNGTFRDVLSLLVPEQTAPTFPNLNEVKNRAHLVELGVNALELLPPSDSDDKLEWGYGTGNYFAADFDLGLPDHQSAPTASTDLANLIKACHQHGLRFFVDAVMAFSRNNPYHNINFLDFYIKWGAGDPEQGSRDGFGGDLFKYNYWVEGYHPISGEKSWLVPAREYMKAYVAHWLQYYRVDGLRLDSVNNVGNYDFLEEFKNFSRWLWRERWGNQNGADERFLVVGEELSVPLSLVRQNRLDGLWNEKFKQIIRRVILGQNAFDESSFEWSVRKLIDCRLLGFANDYEAVNYLTSHDIGGMGNERFFNWLKNNGIHHTEPRIKLAFVCLLTAVGVPMIFAGDEFADEQDLDLSDEHGNHKQIDPVNYSRVKEDWRQRIFQYVARLIKFRTTSEAFSVSNTHFIHCDFNEGKRVVVWQRGNQADKLVVVVANFSDYGTPPGSEYKIPNWPGIPAGKQWKEISQDRMVPNEWAGREGIFPWEAKVYAMI